MTLENLIKIIKIMNYLDFSKILLQIYRLKYYNCFCIE